MQQRVKVPSGRLLAIGDIHGCFGKLSALVEQVAPGQDDRVIFLGDYIDRGSQSRQVLEFLIDFRARFPATVYLRGNHEQMLLDARGGDPYAVALYLQNGGLATLDCYGGGFDRLPSEHLAFIGGLPCLHEEQSFVFAHAGLRPEMAIDRQSERDLLWIRDSFLSSTYDWGKVVVHGHTPSPSVEFRTNRIGIDTGAFMAERQGYDPALGYGLLTCIDLGSKRLWQT